MRGRSLRSAVGLVAIAGAYTAIALLPIGTGSPDVALTCVSGVALAAGIVVIARWITGSRRTQFGVWFALVFLNLAAVAVEGTLFAPAAAPPSSLGANLIRLLAAAVVVAGLASALLGRRDVTHAPGAPVRPMSAWLWRLLAAAAIYIVLYLVIGGVNYTLVTRPYYESHAGSLVVPPAQTVLLYEPVRGLLIALSVLPLTLALRIQPRAAAVVAGVMLFVVGGLVPLLPQTLLPLYLRVASLWEIFGQNFLTGVACAYLFMARGHAAEHRQARDRPLGSVQ
ncbi:MAG TPA: hypothetical protein VFL29_01950 [Candidatus Dormibacteraeota bacterium]|nr:hypothetical protein [Candidatus Dormibacteraeota bacterium]